MREQGRETGRCEGDEKEGGGIQGGGWIGRETEEGKVGRREKNLYTLFCLKFLH